jgi:hypothetical protein
MTKITNQYLLELESLSQYSEWFVELLAGPGYRGKTFLGTLRVYILSFGNSASSSCPVSVPYHWVLFSDLWIIE